MRGRPGKHGKSLHGDPPQDLSFRRQSAHGVMILDFEFLIGKRMDPRPCGHFTNRQFPVEP
jgi:hypothetical protein